MTTRENSASRENRMGWTRRPATLLEAGPKRTMIQSSALSRAVGVFVVMQALWSLGRDGERVVKALCGVDLNVEWNGSEKNRIVARAGSSVMAEQCAALEYLYDMIILGLRQEIMMQGSNDPRVFAELDDIRVNPDFQACVRKSLREADPAFPNCDTLRGQLGWDVWQ